MKKISTFVLCFIYFAVFSQNRGTVILKGSSSLKPGDTVLLSNTNHFKHKIQLDKSQQFSTSVTLDRGYYTLKGSGLLYLSPGMELTIKKNANDYTFAGKGEVENTLLQRLGKLQAEKFSSSSNPASNTLSQVIAAMEPADFLNYAEKFKAEALHLLDRANVDTYFKTTQTANVDYIVRYYSKQYKSRYGIDPEKEDVYRKALREAVSKGATSVSSMKQIMPLYDAMHVKRLSLDDRHKLDVLIWENFDVNQSDLYTFSYPYRDLLTERISTLVSAESIRSPFAANTVSAREELKMKVINKEITSDQIKEENLFQSAYSVIARGRDIENIYTLYINTAKDPYYTAQIKEMYDQIKLTVAGATAPDFSYVDINNKTVSLSSLKGSYVFIDVWATWCMPCIAEIPRLKELEQKYLLKPIKFVSISVDVMKDKAKWEKYVTEHKLSGIQLFADKDFRSDFIKAFGIHAIPRFIIIDPQGKIVSPNAVRPSDPKAEETINGLLTQI